MRTILIEDNPQIRELIKSLLATHCPGVSVVGEAESIEAGRLLLSSVPADLWLLDIELRDGTVFELLDQLDPALFENVGLVFLTAFSTFEYVIQALHKSAVDYLLKPIDPEQLRAAVEKVQKEIADRSLRTRLDELRTLLVRPESTTSSLEKLPVFLSKGAVSYLNLSDILYLEGEDVLTYVHTISDKPVTSVRNLGFYSDLLLKRGGFIRVSKKHLVNTKSIVRYDPTEGIVYLGNGGSILASRRGGQSLLEFFRGVFG
jgi:two-component system LytT family response regulator